MGRAHIEDVFYGGENGGPIEIIVPKTLRREISPHRCRSVLHVFAFHANDENRTFPSISKVAQAVDFDQRKVRVAIKVLEINGLLVKIANYKVGKRGITYHLNLPSFCEFLRPLESEIEEMTWKPRTGERAETVLNPTTDLGTEPVTQSGTPACDKEEVKYKYKDKEELVSFFELAEDPFSAFWFCYPGIKTTDKKARNEWKSVVALVGVSAVVSALAQLLSVPVQDRKCYQPAHEWLADLVDKS